MRNPNFTNEQLGIIYENFRTVHSKLENVFMAIAEEGQISLGDINKRSEISDFIGKQCVAALQITGLIEVYGEGTVKICKLTDEGKKMEELIMRVRKDKK